VKGLNDYSDYVGAIKLFREESFQTIMLTRWKLHLHNTRASLVIDRESVRRDRKKKLVSLGIKHEDREDNDVNEVAKVNQDGWTELVDNTAQHVNDAAQHVDPYASLHSKDRDTLLEWDAEEDSMTEDLKLIDKDIKKLSKRWEEIEEKRRGALTSKKDEGKGGGSKQDPSEPVSEDDVLQKGNSASLSTTFIQREAELLLKTLGEFASFPSSVPSKLIQIGDDFEYVARSFAHAEPKMEQDTRTAEDAVAKRKLEEIRKHKAAQAESSKPDTV
jgi:hypothetical protein